MLFLSTICSIISAGAYTLMIIANYRLSIENKIKTQFGKKISAVIFSIIYIILIPITLTLQYYPIPKTIEDLIGNLLSTVIICIVVFFIAMAVILPILLIRELWKGEENEN